MTNLEKIEQQVAAFPEAELRKFADWFQELQEDLWDKQIEQNAKSGKLDNLADLALSAHKSGKSKTNI